MKKKGILGLIIVLVIVLLLGLVKFWISGVIQRYDRQQHVDTTPDTLAYLFFGIGESENEGIDVHQAVLEAMSGSVSEDASKQPVEEFTEAEQKTLDSFKTVSEGIYSLNYYGDILESEYLDANIKTAEEFDRWMTENLTKGVPTGDFPDMGCSSFATVSPEGDHLFARNYDMDEGDSLVLRMYPEDGYASIGIVDLMHLNLGSRGDYDINDEQGKKLLLAAPWCVCDGINEKGLGISLLTLDDPHQVTDTEKGDLLIYAAIRVILDRCASVDEAVVLLGSYDMYSPSPYTYHFFITDASGRSVIVEWDNDEMHVVDGNAVTNVFLYKDRDVRNIDRRYAMISKALEEKENMSDKDAMEVLESVSRMTRWSAVYDLDHFDVEICFRGDYENSYSYSGRE